MGLSTFFNYSYSFSIIVFLFYFSLSSINHSIIQPFYHTFLSSGYEPGFAGHTYSLKQHLILTLYLHQACKTRNIRLAETTKMPNVALRQPSNINQQTSKPDFIYRLLVDGMIIFMISHIICSSFLSHSSDVHAVNFFDS